MIILKKNNLSPILALLSFFLLMLSTQANSQPYWSGFEHNSSVRIDVVDDRGQYLRKYPTNSRNQNTQRAFVEAVKGKRYQIKIRNTSNRRIGVVVTVDGRNIISGKKSYLRSNEKMYVLDPNESASYQGWRTGKNRINRFYFTSAGDSYSNSWGDRSAMGVIGVAVFDEKQRYKQKRKKFSNRGMDSNAPSASRRYFNESTGTGFGREEYSPTVNVRFVANHQASNKYFYKYEWRSTLCKRGIIRCNNRPNNPRNNNRFWPNDNSGYAPYPPDYQLKDWNDFDLKW